jgi:hypothetical protein
MTSSPAVRIHQCACATCQAGTDPDLTKEHHQVNLLLSRLTEPQRRWYVGTLAAARGGPSASELARITGLDRKTIRRGRRELAGDLATAPASRQRHLGGGRHRAEKKIQPS